MKARHWLFVLHGLFLLYAGSSMLGKMAAGFPWKSVSFFELYGGMIALLGVYAVGWQIILRHIPLSTAYAHRSIALFWGLVFGRCFFGESITVGKVIGIALVMCGLILFDSKWWTDDA